MQVVRTGEAERTEIVQNAFTTLKGIEVCRFEEALPRPASNEARLVDETGFDWDARIQGGGAVRKQSLATTDLGGKRWGSVDCL